LISISPVANNLAYIRLGSLVYISFHGVQIDNPKENERPILNMTIQMIYHKYVSRKKSTRSMTYMIASVNGTWFVHNTLPNSLSLHPCTLVRAITAMGLLNEDVKKKYDSVNLQPKISSHKHMEAVRAERVSTGYDAVKVWEAIYFRDLPATRSPNMRPEGMTPNAIVATTDMKNWTIPRMSGI
jgi:hypothetical protein